MDGRECRPPPTYSRRTHMLGRLRPRSIYDVMAAIGCFSRSGHRHGGYAANTIGSSDIIDGQVKSVDVGDGEIGSADVKDNSINTFDVHSFLGADVVDRSLTGADIEFSSVDGTNLVEGTVTSSRIGDRSLLDRDVGVNAIRNFAGDIGVVNANSCVNRNLQGGALRLNHLLLALHRRCGRGA